jgi:glutamyl-tRNA reductase
LTAATTEPRISAFVAASPEADIAERTAFRPTAESRAAGAGGVAVVTCHRIELYLPSAETPDRDTAGLRALRGDRAAHHAISLAIGLESAVLAEDQILHQLRSAVTDARTRGPLGPDLDLVFDVALRAGRIARSWRPGRARSLADVALERVERSVGALAGRSILVVGTGEMGRLAAAAARTRGARVLLASPTPAHARALAAELGAEAWPVDPGPLVAEVDGLVVALAGPWEISPATASAAERLSVAVDLSMPPAIPGPLADALGDRLVGLDALGEPDVGPEGVESERYRRRLESLRDRSIEDLRRRITARRRAVVAGALAARIEDEREAELAALWRRLPDLPQEQRAAIDGMTRHLAERLFRDPLERLGADPDGRRERAARELFGL